MAQHIKATTAKIVTQNGESTISISIEPIVIEVQVNIVGGEPVVSATAVKQEKDEDDKTQWVVPTFENTRIKFGKSGE